MAVVKIRTPKLQIVEDKVRFIFFRRFNIRLNVKVLYTSFDVNYVGAKETWTESVEMVASLNPELEPKVLNIYDRIPEEYYMYSFIVSILVKLFKPVRVY